MHFSIHILVRLVYTIYYIKIDSNVGGEVGRSVVARVHDVGNYIQLKI